MKVISATETEAKAKQIEKSAEGIYPVVYPSSSVVVASRWVSSSSDPRNGGFLIAGG